VIDPVEDRFILLHLAGAKYVRTLGKAVAPQDGAFFYVG
jgi:CRISPR-associated protein Cas2